MYAPKWWMLIDTTERSVVSEMMTMMTTKNSPERMCRLVGLFVTHTYKKTKEMNERQNYGDKPFNQKAYYLTMALAVHWS